MAVVYFVLAYLWGAIPTAYLAARYLKGVDIRQFGSGNVGSANAMAHLGRRIGFCLGVFDCLGKGTLPVVAARLMGQDLAVQVGVGLAAIAGHNWSPYIGFTGGRGVATAIGVVFSFFGMGMWREFLILGLVMGLIGRLLLKDTGFWTFLSMLALPALAFLFDRPPELLYMSVAIGVLLVMKRLTANWERPDSRYPFVQVLLFRLLWDRDVPRKEEWTERRPRPTEKSL